MIIASTVKWLKEDVGCGTATNDDAVEYIHHSHIRIYYYAKMTQNSSQIINKHPQGARKTN